MSNKIMITGASGFIGARALKKFPDALTVPSELVRVPDGRLEDFVHENRPDIILNCAAISYIEVCEEAREASYSANVLLPTVLAKAGKEVGAKLISFSSDQVYTGCTRECPRREDEELPTPRSIYAVHKLEAEQRVLEIAPDSVMLRATWMYDMPLYRHPNRSNFFMNMLGSIMRREKMSFSKNDYRGITYVRQVVENLDSVFSVSGGVYNYGSENPLSMYDTARALFDSLGLGYLKEELIECSPPRRHALSMDCSKLREQGITFDTTAQGFDRCVSDYFFKIPL